MRPLRSQSEQISFCKRATNPLITGPQRNNPF
jgi:hypothetical protein